MLAIKNVVLPILKYCAFPDSGIVSLCLCVMSCMTFQRPIFPDQLSTLSHRGSLFALYAITCTGYKQKRSILYKDQYSTYAEISYF